MFWRALWIIITSGFFLFWCAPLSAMAFQGEADPVPQDPAAIAVLARMMTQTGWSSLASSLFDITIKSTDYSRSTSGTPITLEARPAQQQFRYDIQNGGSLIRNGNQTRQIAGDRTMFYPAKAAEGLYPAYLPFLTPLVSFLNTAVPVRSLGTQTFDGKQVEAIDVGTTGGAGIYAKNPYSHIVIYVDPATSYPAGAVYDMPAQSNPSLIIPTTWRWSSYARMQGVLLPTAVEESIDGVILRAATIESVQVNTGLVGISF